MFVIVPKHNSLIAHTEPGKSAQAPTRTQNACQGCKVRKAKCDGAKSCSRCHARNILCLYGKMDAAKLAPSMTPERGMMLQEQNDRLVRALCCMATRLDVLESRHSHLSGVNCQATDVLGESTENAQHADITMILDHHAPESANLSSMQESSESEHPGTGASVTYQSKKRRIYNGGGEDSDEQDSLSHMTAPIRQVQT